MAEVNGTNQQTYKTFLEHFDKELVQNHFTHAFTSGQVGRSFNVYIEGKTDDDAVKQYPAILFGRDVFGKVSQCIKFKGNNLYIKRMPKRINQNWLAVPQGAVVVIRCSEVDGITKIDRPEADPNDAKYYFKDYNKCTCDFFTFHETTSAKNFWDAIQQTITGSGHVSIPADHLMHVSRDVSETEPDVPYEQQFNDVFGQALVARYMLPNDENQCFFLFSGGIDSFYVTLRAASLFPEEIEFVLFNVAFKGDDEEDENEKANSDELKPTKSNKRNSKSLSPRKIKDYEEAEDRKGGFAAYQWLVKEFPNRKFTFVRVDVSIDELKAERERSIAYAIAPQNTVLDDSIGCALWFATRAKGYVLGEDGVTKRDVSYDDAKYILVGSGSDELLSGYHRSALCKNYDAIAEDLEGHIQEIGNKNFGRDDRIAFSNKRTLRIPFMDEAVVIFVNQLPLSQKFVFQKPLGEGEKVILRRALRLLGVPEQFYSKPKKAFQFGSNIAKLEKKGEFANAKCERLNIDNDGYDSSDDGPGDVLL
uniref:Asparagine synthetase domain-containing protein n=1 Tax=Panagrellus redivivus TaxID=6233 RepID=A0A7E4VBK5_PANRE